MIIKKQKNCTMTAQILKQTKNSVNKTRGWLELEEDDVKCPRPADFRHIGPIYSWQYWLQPLTGKGAEIIHPIDSWQWQITSACMIGRHKKHGAHKTAQHKKKVHTHQSTSEFAKQLAI